VARAVRTVGLTLAAAIAAAAGCRSPRRATPHGRQSDVARAGTDAPAFAQGCAACHRAEFEAWRGSQHARAQTPGASGLVAPAGAEARGVIGVEPLRQVLVAAAGGRWQVFDPAYDVARGAWFTVFADARTPGAWGHWTGRGLTWNAQCAWCHTTGFTRGYDAVRDVYASRWDAVGVACAQCHGAMDGHPGRASRSRAWRDGAGDGCASCHARREELTGDYRAGEVFDDHFRLSLADVPGAHHPDGQAADEDFERASLALSPMGHRGVTCLDCHDPHSGGLRVANGRDGLCATCHAAGARGAPVITAGHAHHDPAGPGARCVACHMPEATFMQRDHRRDHGFTVPDPALAAELGMPDACAGCHPTWSPAARAGHVDAWFGAGRARPRRWRARLVARAMRGEAGVSAELAGALAGEPNDAWRASLAGMLAAWVDDAVARGALTARLGDRSPWVRAAAARALGGTAPEAVEGLLRDPVRAVRVDAAWSLRGMRPWSPALRAEVERWIEVTSDQPAGVLRRAELAWIEGRPAEARRWAERATGWDPSGPTFAAVARLADAAGDSAGALGALGAAMRVEPTAASHPFARGLVLAAAGRTAEAEADLARAVTLDPSAARAWYNLGLARAALGRSDDALAALGRARALSPRAAEVVWAEATVLHGAGRRAEAAEAARRVLALDATHAGATALLSGASGSARSPR
jgi:tetratricopeptide (TPR) repeat protein